MEMRRVAINIPMPSLVKRMRPITRQMRTTVMSLEKKMRKTRISILFWMNTPSFFSSSCLTGLFQSCACKEHGTGLSPSTPTKLLASEHQKPSRMGKWDDMRNMSVATWKNKKLSESWHRNWTKPMPSDSEYRWISNKQWMGKCKSRDRRMVHRWKQVKHHIETWSQRRERERERNLYFSVVTGMHYRTKTPPGQQPMN